MLNYFEEMFTPEERALISYIPTVPEFVQWLEKTWGDRPAVSDTVVSYSYKEFCHRIGCRRAFLNEQGLQKGDKVAILDTNTIDALELFLAATSGGFVAINLPSQLPGQAVVGCCMKFGVKALFVKDAFADRAEGASCKVFKTNETSEQYAPVAVVDKNDAAAIFFTGGTTGAPKGAVLPHRALMRGSHNGCFSPRGVKEGWKTIGLLPLSHVFGLIRGTMSQLWLGMEWFSADDMKATIGKLPVIKPHTLVLVPGLCDILYGLTKMYGTQFLGGNLNMIISGAANVPPRLIDAFASIGIDLLAGYGMTEGANLTSGNIDVKKKPTSVGKIYPQQEVKIVNGEIWMKGDNVFLGYFGDPEKTAEVLTEDGWLKTGDLGKFDDEGYLYITGRIKNIIVLANGENVSPEEIEEPFYKCAALKDCLVSEVIENGEQFIGIEILPQMPAFEGKPWEEVEAYFKRLVDGINETLPTTHRISKIKVRKEDFKRTGSLKVSRNQN